MDLILNSLRTTLSSLGSPILLLILIAVALFFYKKNKFIEDEQRIILGEKVNSAIELTFSQLTLGLVAGILGSMLLSILGVTFGENSGIEAIFIISFILMFYKKRMACFAYSGAILGLISIFTGYLHNKIEFSSFIEINITALITFVGVMHLIEGVLVFLDGSRGAIPTFKVKEGKVIGGFLLNRYWLLPTVILMISSKDIFNKGVALGKISNNLALINPNNLIMTLLVIPMGLYAILGYRASTFTTTKEKKAKESGGIIVVYAIILILVGQIAKLSDFFAIAAVISMAIFHELMIKYQIYRESLRKYSFVSEEGISILEILPSSPLKKIPLEIGDKIISVNGFKVTDERDIMRIRNEYYGLVTFEIKKKEFIKSYEMNLEKNEKLGILFVPKNVEFKESSSEKRFKEVLENLKKEIAMEKSLETQVLDIREKEIENKGDEN
ncbi:MAG: signal protein PDZ [Sarcina sp.]